MTTPSGFAQGPQFEKGDLVRYEGPAGVFLAEVVDEPLDILITLALPETRAGRVVRVDVPDSRPQADIVLPGDRVAVHPFVTPKGGTTIVARSGEWNRAELPA